jgi:hypothetical protein
VANGKLWTEAEDQFIKQCVAQGCTNAEVLAKFQRHFGVSARGRSAIYRRRYIVAPQTRQKIPNLGDTDVEQLAESFSPPSEEDEKVVVEIEDGDEYGRVYVLASSSIKTPEGLFEACGLDADVWELTPGEHAIKKWDVPMKLKDGKGGQQPVVVPCFYIAIKVRKRWEHSSVPMPIVFELPSMSVKTPSKTDTLTTVHFSDIHFPNQDQRAVDILYSIMSDLPRIDVVVDHGDTLDCSEISAYPKDPDRRVSLKEEIRQGAEHFATVAQLAPNARRIWLEGNHEDRLRRLIWSLSDKRQAGEIFSIDSVKEALQWKNLLGLESLGFEVIPYPRHELLWNLLIVCHGEAARNVSGQSEKQELSKYSKSGLSGHTHRIGGFTQRIYDSSLSWWGLGCLCSLHTQSYINHPNWQQGFALVHWAQDRKTFSVERVRIHDGKAIFRGRTYGS